MAGKANHYEYYFCDKCRSYVYDEQNGDVENGVAANTLVAYLSPDWKCPVCGASARDLRAVTLSDEISKDERLSMRNYSARSELAG